jgi:hypothetical protein
MSKENKDNCGFDEKLSKDSASMNRSGTKGYRDKVVISKIEDNDPDTNFTVENETKVANEVDKVAKDFEYGKGNYSADDKGPVEIERYPEGARHSSELPVLPETEVVGQTSSGLPKVANLDKPADKNKEVY